MSPAPTLSSKTYTPINRLQMFYRLSEWSETMYQTIKNVPDVPCPGYLNHVGARFIAPGCNIPKSFVPAVPCPKPTNQISIPDRQTHQIFYKCPNVSKQASNILAENNTQNPMSPLSRDKSAKRTPSFLATVI